MKKQIVLLLALAMLNGLVAGCRNPSDNDKVKHKAVSSSEPLDNENSEDRKEQAEKSLMIYGKAIHYDADRRTDKIECDAETRTITKTHYDAKGEFERKIQYEYDTVGNEIRAISYDKNGKMQEETKFEYNAGKIIYRASYDENGKIENEGKYEYDTAGNETYYSHTHYGSDGKITEGYGIEYNQSGKRSCKTYYYNGEVSGKKEYKYDDMGNVIREVSYDSDGEITWEGRYEYDTLGNMIREVEYEYEGEFGRDYRYRYDAAGKVIYKASYNEQGNLRREYKYTYEYDNAGNLIREDIYADEKATNSTQYEYNKAGNLMRTTEYDYDDGKVSKINQYEYDESGNLTCETFYDGDGKVTNMTEYTDYQVVPFAVKDPFWEQ